MKTFRDYLEESEYLAENPAVGDVFELEIAREEIMLESYVVDVVEDGIVMSFLNSFPDCIKIAGYCCSDNSSILNGSLVTFFKVMGDVIALKTVIIFDAISSRLLIFSLT
jgi:hypothetical protein